MQPRMKSEYLALGFSAAFCQSDPNRRGDLVLDKQDSEKGITTIWGVRPCCANWP